MADASTVPLTLELVGTTPHHHQHHNPKHSSNSGVDPDDFEPHCRRLATPDGLKLQVTLPRLVDLMCATSATDLLLNGMDGISNNVTVGRVEISNLKFTSDGVGGIMMFMAIQATTVKHLQIQNIVGTNPSRQEEQSLRCLALAFQDSRLETLDLGSNILGAHIWNEFGNQTQLQSLLLENVGMDEESLAVLDDHLEKKMYTGSLSKLCISNRYPTSENAIRSGNNILYRCTNLRSLRWANRGNNEVGGLGTTSLPCHGLHQLAQKMFRLTAHLRHLELENAVLSDADFEANGLCGALELLHRLNHLKLRNLSITPNRTKQLLTALKTGRLPLRSLDLSKNELGNEGAEVIAQIADIRSLATNLKQLNLEHNGICNIGATALISSLGAKGIEEIEIRTDGNPLNMTQVALGIAAENFELEEERDQLLIQESVRALKSASNSAASVSSSDNGDPQNVRNLLAAQASMVSDMQMLQTEVQKLTQERDTLIGAFSVLGAVKAVEEKSSVLERLSRLEESVHGRRGGGSKYPSAKTRKSFRSGTIATSQSGLRENNATSQATTIAKGIPGKIRPSNAKERRAVSPIGPVPISRDEVRARVLAEVASLQSKKDQVRSTILSDVETIKSQRSQSNNVGLHARLQAKISAQNEDRARVWEDLARLQPDRPQRWESVVKRRASSSAIQRNDSLSLGSQRRESFSSIQLPETNLRQHESIGSSTASRSHSGTDKSSGPEVLLPNQSFHSEDHDPEPSLKREDRSLKNNQSSSGRFQHLLHRQIQNQLFRSYRNDEGSLKSESQRSLELTGSSHHSTQSKCAISNRRVMEFSPESFSDSTQGDNKPRTTSLQAFIENDRPDQISSSSQSLPAAEMFRSTLLSPTKEEGDDHSRPVFRKTPSTRSLEFTIDSPPSTRSDPRGANKRKDAEKGVANRKRREFTIDNPPSSRSGRRVAREGLEKQGVDHRKSQFDAHRSKFNKSMSEANLGGGRSARSSDYDHRLLLAGSLHSTGGGSFHENTLPKNSND